jgi:predicted metal-binding protein
MLTRFSDGTICDYCGNLILTELGINYKENGRVFCCKECADDFKNNKHNNEYYEENVQ